MLMSEAVCHRSKQMVVGRSKICKVRRLPFQCFQVGFYRFCNIGPTVDILQNRRLSASTRIEPNFLASESFRWEYSMSLSRSFLQMKAENQNCPQMTRIWLEKWHIWSRIKLWCKHKFTNAVLSLCWQMSKLTVWCFWSAYFLPLVYNETQEIRLNIGFNNVTYVYHTGCLINITTVFDLRFWPHA